MLNYVWLALLFLGLGAALSTDLINQGKDKYRNNQPLPVAIEFSTTYDKSKDKSYEVNLKVKASDFNNFYKEDIKNDLSLPAKISTNRKEGKTTLYSQISESSPVIWKEIARVSGEEDDLTGKIRLTSFSSDTKAEGYMI